ncbi:MAG: tetratricopeptide repeat protein [Dehalococcoidales bacterium]|nr:tetratricopeptide repeat protein [Dehalococcoidales bacterium]
MSYEKEEQARLMRQQSKNAIALAMEGHWREAVEANKAIIESFPDDVDSFNRLGRAYMELGEYAAASEAYTRARQLYPHNTIAEKNLHRIAQLIEAGAKPEENASKVETNVFIEETGKAGVVKLIHLAPKKELAMVDAGDRVLLKIADSDLIVENTRGEYLGLIEPRHSQRLIRLMNGGNRYSATVISASDEKLEIIIRETYQHPSQFGQLSFPSKGTNNIRPYISDKLLRRRLEYDDSLSEMEYTADNAEDMDLLSEEIAEDSDENDELIEEDEQEV